MLQVWPLRYKSQSMGLLGEAHLAPQVATLLLRGQLVLKVHASSARLDHRLHELEAVERAAKASLSISHNGRIPVNLHG